MERYSAHTSERAGRSWTRDLLLLLVGAVVGILGNFFGPPLLRSLEGEDPSVAAQLESIEHREASRGYYPIVHLGDMHGFGAPSYFIDFRDTSAHSGQDPSGRPGSDRIQIYDTGDRRATKHLAARFSFLPGPELPGDTYWLFYLHNIEDINHDGHVEIVGTFRELLGDHPRSFPVLISWSDAHERYKIRSLIPSPPSLANMAGGVLGSGFRAGAQSGTSIADAATHIALQAYSAGDFAIRTVREQPVLITSYIAQQSDYRSRLYQIVAFPIQSERQERPSQCSDETLGGVRHEFVRRPPSDPPSGNEAATLWLARHTFCG